MDATAHQRSDAAAPQPKYATTQPPSSTATQQATGASTEPRTGLDDHRPPTAHAHNDATAQPGEPAKSNVATYAGAHAHNGATGLVPVSDASSEPSYAATHARSEDAIGSGRSGPNDAGAHASLRAVKAGEGEGEGDEDGLDNNASAHARALPSPPRGKKRGAPARPKMPSLAAPVVNDGGARAPRRSTGSLRNPYARKDGVKMVNVTLSIPADLAQQWREFCARLPTGTRGEWTARWLDYAMSWDGQSPPET